MLPENNHSAPIEHHYEYEVICEIVEKKSRVLDLGCGEGDLLKLLQEQLGVEGAGVEVAEEKVYSCVSKGLSVYHGDIDEGLADFPDKSFDYVILSETLQEVRKPALVIKEMLRVGSHCIVSFPNFGYWTGRLQLLMGYCPITLTLPYEWYEGPNIQFLTIYDFFRFCRKLKYSPVRSYYFRNGRPVRFCPNLLADSALFMLT